MVCSWKVSNIRSTKKLQFFISHFCALKNVNFRLQWYKRILKYTFKIFQCHHHLTASDACIRQNSNILLWIVMLLEFGFFTLKLKPCRDLEYSSFIPFDWHDLASNEPKPSNSSPIYPYDFDTTTSTTIQSWFEL